jgi:group I intron endonuclease
MKKLNRSDISIYFIENRLNGKIYVGKAIDPKKRWRTHRCVANKGKEKYPNKYFAVHAAISKYGSDNFSFVIIERCRNNHEANQAERDWISCLKGLGVLLYNETEGGDGSSPGVKFTEEHKKRISVAKLGKKASPEARMNMSKARKLEFAGEKNNKVKINEDTVRLIRCMYATGQHTHRQLASMFGLTHATIGKIVRRELWAHIQ